MPDLCMWSILILSSIYDFSRKRIPVLLLGLGGAAGLLVMMWQKQSGYLWILDIMPGTILLVLGLVSGERIGYGDGFLAVILGLLKGWKLCTAAICIALILISTFCAVMLVLRKVTGKTEIPFVPFLLAAHIFLAVGIG